MEGLRFTASTKKEVKNLRIDGAPRDFRNFLNSMVPTLSLRNIF